MKNKILKSINYTLVIISIVVSLCFVIFRDKELGLILKDLSIVFTMLLPFILDRFIRIDNKTKTVYLIFVFSAHFLGAVCELYNKIYFFDKLVHWFSGVFTAYLAILLLKYMKKYNKKNICFNILFMISITFMIAGMWEIFEFTANILFGGDAQRVVETGVTDTMLDIIVAFLGSIMYSALYFFKVK